MRKILTAIVLMLFSVSANAAPSTTQIGTTKTSNPYPVSILYNGTWYPMGVINTTSGYFLTKVENGGTGISTGTSGGIPYFSSTSTIASSTALTQYGIMYGGGAGLAPSSTAAGAADNILKGNGAAAPTFASLSSIIDSALTASTQGSILYRGASSWAALGPGTSGQVLRSNGAAANPSWTSAGSGSVYTPAVDAVGVCGVDNTGASDTLSSLNTCLSTYYAISLRPGIYKVSGTVTVSQNNSILGAGYGPIASTSSAPAYNGTIIKTTSNTASVVSIGSNATISGVMIDRYNPDTAATAGCGIDASAGATNTVINYVWVTNVFRGVCLGPSAQGWVQNSVILNNYSHGVYINVTSDPTHQWQLQSVLSNYNNGYGFYFNTSVVNTTPGHWFNTSTFANGLGGYYFAATGSGNLNDLGLTQLGAGSDCGAGVTIDVKTGIANFINGFFVELSGVGSPIGGCGHISSSGTVAIPGNVTGYGINYISGSQFTFAEGIFFTNNNAGFNVGASATGDVTVSNSYFQENGNLNTTNPAGIIINGAMRVNLSHNTFTSTYLGTQINGIVLQGTGVTGVIMGNIARNTTNFGIFSAATTASSLLVMGNDFAGGGTGCSIVVGTAKPTGTSATLNNGSNCP